MLWALVILGILFGCGKEPERRQDSEKSDASNSLILGESQTYNPGRFSYPYPDDLTEVDSAVILGDIVAFDGKSTEKKCDLDFYDACIANPDTKFKVFVQYLSRAAIAPKILDGNTCQVHFRNRVTNKVYVDSNAQRFFAENSKEVFFKNVVGLNPNFNKGSPDVYKYALPIERATLKSQMIIVSSPGPGDFDVYADCSGYRSGTFFGRPDRSQFISIEPQFPTPLFHDKSCSGDLRAIGVYKINPYNSIYQRSSLNISPKISTSTPIDMKLRSFSSLYDFLAPNDFFLPKTIGSFRQLINVPHSLSVSTHLGYKKGGGYCEIGPNQNRTNRFDVNRDGVIDYLDLEAIQFFIKNDQPYNSSIKHFHLTRSYDVNGDRRVDSGDAKALLGEINKNYPEIILPDADERRYEVGGGVMQFIEDIDNKPYIYYSVTHSPGISSRDVFSRCDIRFIKFSSSSSPKSFSIGEKSLIPTQATTSGSSNATKMEAKAFILAPEGAEALASLECSLLGSGSVSVIAQIPIRQPKKVPAKYGTREQSCRADVRAFGRVNRIDTALFQSHIELEMSTDLGFSTHMFTYNSQTNPLPKSRNNLIYIKKGQVSDLPSFLKSGACLGLYGGGLIQTGDQTGQQSYLETSLEDVCQCGPVHDKKQPLDVNQDGKVDELDVSDLQRYVDLNQHSQSLADKAQGGLLDFKYAADIDGDGKATSNDLIVLQNHFRSLFKHDKSQPFGMRLANLTSSLKSQFGITRSRGLVVTSVQIASEAATQKVRVGSVLISVNGIPILTLDDFNQGILKHNRSTAILEFEVYSQGTGSTQVNPIIERVSGFRLDVTDDNRFDDSDRLFLDLVRSVPGCGSTLVGQRCSPSLNASLPSDVNGDRNVTQDDLKELRQYMDEQDPLKRLKSNIARFFDINGDGKVDKSDELILVESLKAPSISVVGRKSLNLHGDRSPDPEKGTDFGKAPLYSDFKSQTFYIQNVGDAPLLLANAPIIVKITGVHASDFLIPNQPKVSTLGRSFTDSFTIRFKPTARGKRQALISIESNDPKVSRLFFVVQGEGIAPPVPVNDVTIPSDDGSPCNAPARPLYQNCRDKYDVNNDNQVTSADALRIINKVSSLKGGSHVLSNQNNPEGVFYDVNGDGKIASVDALLIINELSRRNRSGQK